jgi:predicted ribosomally synthesized peptide with nif11-like leader
MSRAEIDRFSNDAKTNSTLQQEIKSKGGEIPSLIQIAKAHRYDISENDVREYIKAHGAELSDEQIESVVGGVAASMSIPTILTRIVVVILFAK